jgi:hypothetical protein
VNELVIRGLKDADVLGHPPTTEQELAYMAETITDHVVAAVELSREQKRSGWHRRRGAQTPYSVSLRAACEGG